MKNRSRAFPIASAVLCALAAAACAKQEAPAPGPAASAHAASAPVCKEGSQRNYPDGKLKECLLGQDWVTGPYTCRANWSLVLHPGGTLKECRITGTATFDGVVVKDSLALYEDGKLRRGILGAAKTFGDTEARVGDWVTLYPGGALNRLELSAGPRTIKGYPCKGSENYFYENGHLKKCTLAEPFKRGKTEIPAGTLLCFDESGQPKEPCGLMTP